MISVILQKIDYATARAYEQYYMEIYKTLTEIRGVPPSPENNGNKNNSFLHDRDDRGIAFETEYKNINCVE